MRRINKRRAVIAIPIMFLCVAGCGPTWKAAVIGPDGSPITIDAQTLDGLSDFAEEVDGQQAVPLERVLAANGYVLIEQVSVTGSDGQSQGFNWAEVADNAWWMKNGQLVIGGQAFTPREIQVEPPDLPMPVQARIIDIAPTAAATLSLPPLNEATGHALVNTRASHVLLLYIDGFGYLRYQEALDAGLIPYLAELEPLLVALTTYPPITPVSTASLLTGAPPAVHAVTERGIRSTETETLFDLAVKAGRRVVAVEGGALAFNLRSAELTLSGDRDGSGGTDDNVLANTLAVFKEGMPDLLFVHFHGVDDAGHTYGPGTPEEIEIIRAMDEAVGRLLESTPPDTLVMIFSDHGMHTVTEDGRQGNHGHLIEEDMLIPIFVIEK